MKVYRKSLIIQLMLFMVFFIMGAYVIAEYYLLSSNRWLGYVLLGVLLSFGIFGFYFYKKGNQDVSVITEKEMKTIKYLLYGYFGVYILEIFLSTVNSINQEMLAIAVGVILMAIAIYGIFIQYRILKVK
jgi:polyferredoxin